MPDYKAMYLKMFIASEQAINILIAAQQECEKDYTSASEPPFQLIPFLLDNKKIPVPKYKRHVQKNKKLKY